MHVRRLRLGDEAIVRELATREPRVLTNASNSDAMGFYASRGATRPHDDDVMWDLDFEGGR